MNTIRRNNGIDLSEDEDGEDFPSRFLPRENTPSGSEAPSWLPSPPSRRCGSPSRNTTRQDPESFTVNAFKFCLYLHYASQKDFDHCSKLSIKISFIPISCFRYLNL